MFLFTVTKENNLNENLINVLQLGSQTPQRHFHLEKVRDPMLWQNKLDQLIASTRVLRVDKFIC